jgi:hypothetical protein
VPPDWWQACHPRVIGRSWEPELQERTVPAGLNPDGCANAADLADQLAWFRSAGYLQRDLELDAVLDNRFCERAVQELGRYGN